MSFVTLIVVTEVSDDELFMGATFATESVPFRGSYPIVL